ncbi:MAG: phage tail tape measure protein [Nitrospira sp.]|nr:MAG: phage tail tape measure protein [Nitrospira sp.]
MATETKLGNLVVELIGRSDKFEAALKGIEGRLSTFGREAQSQLKKIDQSITNTGKGGFSKFQASIVTLNQGLQLAARFVGGLTRLTTGALQSADAIHDTAQQLGIGAEQLQEWQFAAAQSGSSAEAFTIALQKFEQNLGKAASGTGEASKVLKALGVDAKALAADPLKALDLIADKLAAIPNPAQRAQIALALLGKGGASMIPVLQQGSGVLAQLRQEAHDTGNVITDDLVKSGAELNDKFTAAAAALDKQFKGALIGLAPVITTALEKLGPLAKAAADILSVVLQANTIGRQGRMQEINEELAALQAEFVRVQEEQADSLFPGFGARADEIRAEMQTLTDEFAKLEGQTQQLGHTAAQTGGALDTELAVALGKTETAADKAAKATAQATAQAREAIATIQGSLAVDIISVGLPEVEQRVLDVTDRILEAGAKGSLGFGEIETAVTDTTAAVRQLAAVTATFQIDELLKDLTFDADTAGLTDFEKQIRDVKKRIEELGKAGGLSQAIITEKTDEATAALRKEREALGAIQLDDFFKDIQHDIDSVGLDEFDRQILDVTRHFQEMAKEGLIPFDALPGKIAAATAKIEELRKKTTALTDALLTTGDLKDVGADFLDDLFDRKLSTRAFRKKGEEIGKELIHGIFFGKSKEEHQIIGNFNELVGVDKGGGILGGIFKQGGIFAGENFADEFLKNGTSIVQGNSQGSIPGIFSSTASGAGQAGTQAGTSWGSAFGVASIASIGATAGSAFSTGKYGTGAGTVAGAAIGAYFGGPQGAAIGGQLGAFFGSFFDPFFAPQRIEKERKRLKKFLEQVFDVDVPLKGIEKIRDAAEANFDAIEGALSALGVSFALEAKKGGIGTVKRFGNLSQAAFEQAGFSAKEARAEVLRLADAMDFDLLQSIRDVNDALGGAFAKDNQLSLKEYREEVREGQTDILTLGDILTGTLEIFTAFSPVINESALAARFLSEEFLQTAQATGLMDARVEALALQVRAGLIPFEEAVIQLNAIRKAAGLGGLELADFHLDANTISEEAARIVAVANDIGQSAGDALSRGFADGLSTGEMEAAFAEVVKGIARDAIIAKVFTDNIESIFAGIDLTDPFALTNDQIEIMADRLGVAYDSLQQILSAAGLLPDALGEVADSVQGISNEFRTLGKDIQGIIDSLLFSDQSPLLPTEQLGLLKEREQALRASLATADPDAVPQILRDLGDVLNRQSGLSADVFGVSSTAYLGEFNAIIAELEAIRNQATAAAASIDQQLLDSGLRQEDLLAQIRDTIAQGLGVEVHAATGLNRIFQSRTRIEVGEAGPEYVWAQPLSRMASAKMSTLSGLTNPAPKYISLSVMMPPGAVVITGGCRKDGAAAADAFVETLLQTLRSDARVRSAFREVTGH